jgi:hypothetical protein
MGGNQELREKGYSGRGAVPSRSAKYRLCCTNVQFKLLRSYFLKGVAFHIPIDELAKHCHVNLQFISRGAAAGAVAMRRESFRQHNLGGRRGLPQPLVHIFGAHLVRNKALCRQLPHVEWHCCDLALLIWLTALFGLFSN